MYTKENAIDKKTREMILFEYDTGKFSKQQVADRFGVSRTSVVRIIDERNEAEKDQRHIVKHLLPSRSETERMDNSLKDAETFKTWLMRVKYTLASSKLYNNLEVVHVGPTDFTYRSNSGYTKSVSYIDLYKRG